MSLEYFTVSSTQSLLRRMFGPSWSVAAGERRLLNNEEVHCVCVCVCVCVYIYIYIYIYIYSANVVTVTRLWRMGDSGNVAGTGDVRDACRIFGGST